MDSTARSYWVDENIVTEADDWLDAVTGEFRTALLDTVRALPIADVQRFPPPKPGRIPFGHELRVLGKFMSKGNALFDPSAFHRLYRSAAGPVQRLIYRAFLNSETLSDAEWTQLIGAENLDTWREKRLLREGEGGWSCRFRLCPIGTVLLFGDAERPKLRRRVVIGQDSYNMVEFLRERRLGRFRRSLDVGPGSGVVLLNAARHSDEAVGVDINRRAVAISRLGAELNGIDHCTVHDADALEMGTRYGTFDLVTWNTPFVFMPDECRGAHLDAFGGHLGLELPLKFIEVLPELLAPDGVSYLGMSAPISRDGENLMERELERMAPELGLDIDNHVLQTYWHGLYREFHEAHGIVKNELVFLELRRGGGKLRRIERPVMRRVSDAAREIAYRVLR